MQVSLLTVVNMILVLVSAHAESTSLRGGSMKPEPQPETASPISNPTSESEPETASPTSNPTTLPIGSGCCSQNFRTCVSFSGDSKESCELLGSMIWLENGDLPQQCLEQDSACTDDLNACCPGLTCDGDQWYKQCKFMPNTTRSPTSAPTAFLTKPSDSPSSNRDTIESLRKTIADLEASSLATIESLEESKESLAESIVQKDSIIADLTLQIETIGVPTDPPSQCNAEDGELAFDTCRCNELSVLTRNACKDVPVDCDNGFERGTDVTCDRACDGECCAGGTRIDGSDSPCRGFTGLVHRDGSCIGPRACQNANIDEVQGQSCTGSNACQNANIDELQGPSCTGSNACRHVKSTLVEASCNGDDVCYRAEVGLIVGSCTGSTLCNGEITDSIVDGQLLREEACNGEFSCRRGYNNQSIIATSIVDGTIYYSPRDPKDVCGEDCQTAYLAAGSDGVGGVPGSGRTECNDDEFAAYPGWCAYLPCMDECREEFPPRDPLLACNEDCHSAYAAAGSDGVGGVPGSGRTECNDDEFAAYPGWCAYLPCMDECQEEFPSIDEGRDPFPDFDKEFSSSDEGRKPFPNFD